MPDDHAPDGAAGTPDLAARGGVARTPDGLRIAYSVRGDGPPVVAVHATGFHRGVWAPWLPKLAERFRVVTLDQRGHGDSDKPESGYAWEGFATDVLAVVDALGLGDPAGIGHSAGAAALALAEASRPHTFSRLVLMDPVCAPPEVRELARSGPNPMAAATRKRRRVWPSHNAMVERLREGSPLHAWREDVLRAYVEGGTRLLADGTIELKCPPAGEAQIYEMGMVHKGWEAIGELRCPTLLLAGETSELWPARPRERIAGALAEGRVEIVRGGHFFPQENPDDTLERVLGFLDER